VRLSARDVALRPVMLLCSDVCFASVSAHLTSLLQSKNITMPTA